MTARRWLAFRHDAGPLRIASCVVPCCLLLLLTAAAVGNSGAVAGSPAAGLGDRPSEAAPQDRPAALPSAMKPVYLNIIWHQHQPLYVSPETDQLSGPWVRTHATKDYYDMAAMLKAYPDVHCTVNLTSSLLLQLRDYYVDRLGPFVDTRTNEMEAKGFLARWKGKTDPWIDLMLKNTALFDSADLAHLYGNAWNAFGISEVQLSRFPEYRALRKKLQAAGTSRSGIFNEQELREIKFWFYLAHFDPDFLLGAVALPVGGVCDLSGFVKRQDDGTFLLRRRPTERDCRRMVIEAYKVMAAVIPVHRELRYDAKKGTGQIDVITTPYYHPILPLIYDSDLARECQPRDSLPPRFSYPQDVEAQVAKTVKLYREVFGVPPSGMWPGEGSVAQPVLPLLRRHGILWTASDVRVLNRSTPEGMPNTTPYRFPAGPRGGADTTAAMALVFRDTELSDRIGFTYQQTDPEEAAEDFVRTILARAPRTGAPDVLVTVILDGENAWEWYQKDMDGKQFLHALYRKLSTLHRQRRIVTVTMSEYLAGNARRSVPAHAPASLPAMTRLWSGSWINGNFDTWIGEQEENAGWFSLLQVRRDLEASGLKRPDPAGPVPRTGSKAWNVWKAWEAMYAAEGSDWFWWYGSDQTAPGGDLPFDQAFLTHLKNVYVFAARAGASMKQPVLTPILPADSAAGGGVPAFAAAGGVMAEASARRAGVIFRCDARAENVTRAVYIAGNMPELGNWRPNAIAMRDDGTAGDDRAGDGIWSLRVEVPTGSVVFYKYTNSGETGAWTPGEEFAGRNRTLTVPEQTDTTIIVQDTFGQQP